jgi:hypothetical protein
VLLLSGAQYGGTWDSGTGYVPLAYGTFQKFKAVYKSGFITCDTKEDSQYYWQTCGRHPVLGGQIAYSFELKKNSNYVVEQPDWWKLPPECNVPGTPTGDIVCHEALTLAQGDKITPSWYEPSHQISINDNGGIITIDLYGLRNDWVRSTHVLPSLCKIGL